LPQDIADVLTPSSLTGAIVASPAIVTAPIPAS
jgi:hypothetical protein